MAGQAKTFSGKWVVKIWLKFDARETICFRKTNQRGGDGNLEGREGALRNADQTVHKEAMEQVPKCRFILVPCSLMAKTMFRSLMQKYSQDFHTGKTGMIGNKLDKWIPVRKLTLKPRYFDDPWQHLPKDGYTRMFENMLLKVFNFMWTFFMLSLPGSEDHSTSGNRLLPGIVIDDKEGHHYILLILYFLSLSE